MLDLDGKQVIVKLGLQFLEARPKLGDDLWIEGEPVLVVAFPVHSDSSVAAYRSRFSRIMDYYSNYLTSGAVPKVRLQGTAPNRSRQRETEGPTQQVTAASPQEVSPEASDSPRTTGMISYPFPLQSGGIANLRLPVRLEQTDADRLGAFIRTLVYEPQKQLVQARTNQQTRVKEKRRGSLREGRARAAYCVRLENSWGLTFDPGSKAATASS